MKHFRAQFPPVKLNAKDTMGFVTEGFIRGTLDTTKTKYFYDLLLHQDTGYNYFEYTTECFFRPKLRAQMNGQEIFVGEYGDTNELAIYYGKDVLLFVYDQKKGFRYPFVLASEHAGEGPWFQTDSWFVDLNHDRKIDILTRHIGGYMEREDENGVDIWNYILVDDLDARTLNDTGFVKLEISNPDSLREIYGRYPD